jgi:hypothetical protein
MTNKHTNTSVSLAINQTMNLYNKRLPLVEKTNNPEYIIKVANNIEERESVFKLGYKIYLEKGFINKNAKEWLVRNYDSKSETTILIVQDKEKNIIGSATIVFGGTTKLPAVKNFAEEINVLREHGNKIAELSRLVISHEYRYSKEILTLLFNYSAIYIHHVKNYDGLVIQVNPRHKNYYKTLLNFDEIGREKPCQNVNNAPANLLYLSAKKYQSAINQCSVIQLTEKKDRSLFPYFLKPEQENLVAHYLEKQVKPMSASEKFYFGFSASNTCLAAAIIN